MTARENSIAKKILDYLHEEEGRQVHALTIMGGIGGLNACRTAEFDAVLAELEAGRYVIAVNTKFKGVLYNISDAGEAARLEM